MVTEQQSLLLLGSVLIMFGLFMLMFSIKPRQSGSTGILLLGPIPVVWRGRSRMMIFLIPLIFFALLFALVFVL